MTNDQAIFDRLHATAKAADDDFERALKRQFGPEASRWRVPEANYNAETRAAHGEKCTADEALRRHFDRRRGDAVRFDRFERPARTKTVDL